MSFYKILLVFLHFMYLRRVHTLYYACPPTSLCVPPAYCTPENVTFNAEDENFQKKYEHKYVCGVLSECEGNICCNDPIGLPDNYQPNKTHWCYGRETDDTILNEEEKVPVVLYPGLESRTTPAENKVRQIQLCPPLSVCVSGIICPRESITFIFGISTGMYSCGNITAELVCCAARAIGLFPVIEKRNKPSFLKGNLNKEPNYIKKDSSKSSWSYFDSDYASKYEGVSAKEEKIYKEITGKSTNIQDWTCGRTLSISSELLRIYAPIGDREAKEGDFPWHVAILSSTYEYLCSGVIVDEKVVVTIAHCFDKYNSSREILVRVGDLNLIEENEKNPAFDVRVKHLSIHPDYNKIKLEADIAVIEMEESVRGLSHVRPACLPGSGFSPAINHCKVPGWGQFSKSKEAKNEFNYSLRSASFYQIDKTECQNSLRRVNELGAFFKLQKNVLCAKGYSNADTCKGDGGSGLVCRDKDVYVLEGLVSYGFGCGLNHPGVYTDVQKYLEFIKNYKIYLPGGDKSRSKQIYKNSNIKISNDDYDKPSQDTNKIYVDKQFDTYKPSKQNDGQINAYFTPVEQESNHFGSEQLYSQSHFELKEPLYVEGTYNGDHFASQIPEYIHSSPQISSQSSFQEEKQRFEHKLKNEHSSYTSYNKNFDKTSKYENLDVPLSEYEKKNIDYLSPVQDYGNIPSSDDLLPVNDYGIPSSDYLPPVNGYDIPSSDYLPPVNGYDIPSSDYLPPVNGYNNIPSSDYLPSPVNDYGTVNYGNLPSSNYLPPSINDYNNIPSSDYLPSSVKDYGNTLSSDHLPLLFNDYGNSPVSNYLPLPPVDDYSNIQESDYLAPPANDYGNVPATDYQPPVNDYGNNLKSDYLPSHVNGNEHYRHDEYLGNDDDTFESTYHGPGKTRKEYINPDGIYQPSNSIYNRPGYLNEDLFTEPDDYQPRRSIYEPEYLPHKYLKLDNNYESNRYILDQLEYGRHKYGQRESEQPKYLPHEPEYEPEYEHEYGRPEPVPSIYDQPGYLPNDYEHAEQFEYNPSKATYDSSLGDKYEHDDYGGYRPNKYSYDNDYLNKNYDEIYYDVEPELYDPERESDYLPEDYLPEKYDPDYYKFNKDYSEHYDSFNKEYENDYRDMRNYKRGPSKDQNEKFHYITPKNAKLKSSYSAKNAPGAFSNVLNIYKKIKDIDSASEITVGKVKSPISLLHKV